MGAIVFQAIGYFLFFWEQNDKLYSGKFGESNYQLPFAAMMILGMTFICYSLLIFTTRAIVFRYGHFQKAIGFIQEFDQHLPDIKGFKNTVRRRTLIGWIFIVISVCSGISVFAFFRLT